MSVWTGTNPSPGPRRLMKTPSQSTLSPKGARGSGVKRAPAKKAGIVTEICVEGENNERSCLLEVLQLVICYSELAFVFYNIPGSFVQFRPRQNPSAASGTGVIISSGMRRPAMEV